MALAPRRRRRRRPWGLYLVLITLILVTIPLVRSTRSDAPERRLSELAYIDQVRPLVERSTTQGAALNQLRVDGLRLGRDGLTRGLERVRRESEAVLGELQVTRAPSSIATAHSMLTSTMVLRARAAANIKQSVDHASSASALPLLVDAWVSAGHDLSASDRTYQVFLDSLPVEAKASAMPPSRWVDDASRWSREELAAFVASVRASFTPIPLHDVSLVTVGLKPAPLGNESGMAVLPLVKAMNLEVVVANTGNAEERSVALVATFVGPAGEGEPVREEVNLEPGQRRAMQMRGLKQLGLGPATLRVAIGPVPGETATDDNQRSLPVVVRG